MCPVAATASDTGFDKQFACSINGQQTEFVFQRFANKWFLIITQYGRLPNLYTVRFDIKSDERLQMPQLHGPILDPDFYVSVPISMTCSFGADKDEIRGAIQFLVNRTALNRCPTEFMICLGIKQVDSANLRELAEVLDKKIFSET